MNTCEVCGRVYDYERKQGHTKVKCNSCLVSMRRFAKREKILDHFVLYCPCKAAKSPLLLVAAIAYEGRQILWGKMI